MSSYDYLKIAVVLALFSLPLAVALSSASYFGVEAELSEPWSYDDWRFSDSVVDAEGSVELVEVDGRTAVHAVSLGDGSITLDNGRRISVDVGKADLDVYLIMGQSNAAYYRYEPDRAVPVSVPGSCYYFGANMPISLANHAAMVAGEYDTTFASYGMHDMTNPDGTTRIGN